MAEVTALEAVLSTEDFGLERPPQPVQVQKPSVRTRSGSKRSGGRGLPLRPRVVARGSCRYANGTSDGPCLEAEEGQPIWFSHLESSWVVYVGERGKWGVMWRERRCGGRD